MGPNGMRSNWAGWDLSGSDQTGQVGARSGRISLKWVRLNQAGWDPSRSDQAGQDEAELERMGSAPTALDQIQRASVLRLGGSQSHPNGSC